ncbi:conserved protein containing a thioredoxin domain protein [Rubidibacter lacunae KORDI 51-2]|uniref:Conserved protein containing a thioredoxin domain protein n=1 Tax=Rubidibacter lacunae KORDI 51-2 TaxID=582515 RepID=U5DA44_9CHRO|nr:thioredoxin domain-containing protein [Rubidibacter lacunae]ERN41453.1 conserved protein containing a thioredoxin domain protein [Rubidibacter lacunae KORDI 51-2]
MPNRLASAQSLYLRKHADNPVDWWPWCDEALEKAAAEDKPIFLSVGYSSCHWCTVMEGEAFSNAAIAEYLNAHFVPVKIDREERPDLDSIYMQALQLMTGRGGWPLNIFLTPGDRVPFYGGTYFPIVARFGQPPFLDVLQSVRVFYDRKKSKLQEMKTEMMGMLQQSVVLPQIDQPLPETLLSDGLNAAVGIASSHGAPSFPMMPYAEAALRATRRQSDDSPYDALKVCTQRGLDLALGGINDHAGGGFHRYTVDATWTVPHFEKMLYDNGQILEFLANLWSAGIREPSFRQAIAGTVQWLQREMTAPEGYFYAAQDADSFSGTDDTEPEEGAFYVWSYTDLQKLLAAEELHALETEFTVSPTGNFEGRNVLQRRPADELLGEMGKTAELSAAAEAALQKLFTARYGTPAADLAIFPPARDNRDAKTEAWPGRIPPVTDTKAIVAWNSLAISGLARAYAVFGEETYGNCAVRAATFLLENQWVGDRFHRLNYDGRAAVPAQSEDYALFVKALLDLHACYPEQTQWLQQAVRVQSEFDAHLWSSEPGGYFNAADDASSELLLRERSYTDNATPAANGIAAANLVRLYLLTEDLTYFDRAEHLLTAFGAIMQKAAGMCPSLFSALDWFRNATLVRSRSNQLQELMPHYAPTCVYRLDTEIPEDVVGLVCRGLSCLKPARDRNQLRAQIQQTQARS